VIDPRRPMRRTPIKALVRKTYHFAEEVWEVYIHKNIQEMR